MVEIKQDQESIEPSQSVAETTESLNVSGRLRDMTRSFNSRFIRALKRVKAKTLRRFPYSIDEVPEGETGINWILRHREEVFPSVKREIQFDNGGAPSQSNFYSEAAGKHSKYVTEMGYAHWPRTNEKISESRQEAASLLNCSPEEIAFEENTSEGVRNVVEKFDWKEGDQIVVLRKDMEYPTNYAPWESLERIGVSIVQVGDKNGLVTPEEIQKVLSENSRIRMVALSSVGWKTGQRVDLENIGQAIASHNSEGGNTRFFVDAIQSLGQHKVDVRAANIDYLAAGGSKWLLAGSGRGIFYCSRDGLSDIRKEGFGASSQKDAHTPDSELREDATIFEEGMKNFDSIVGLGASMKLINRIGIENIEKRIEKLTDYLCIKLQMIGYEVTSPRDAKSKSGLVLFRHSTIDSKTINQKLQKSDKPIWMSIRNGNLRACIHYYNTEQEIDELISRLPKETEYDSNNPDYFKRISRERGYSSICTNEEIENAIQSTIKYCRKDRKMDTDYYFQKLLTPIIDRKEQEIYSTLSDQGRQIYDDFLTDNPGKTKVQKLRKLEYGKHMREQILESEEGPDGKSLLYAGSGTDLGLPMLTGIQSIIMVDPALDEAAINELVDKVRKYDPNANFNKSKNLLTFEFSEKKYSVTFYQETLEEFNKRGEVKADIGMTHSGVPYFSEQEVRKSLNENALFFEVQKLYSQNQ